MTEFKFIKEKGEYYNIEKYNSIALTEIAYQLKRIADNTEGLKK